MLSRKTPVVNTHPRDRRLDRRNLAVSMLGTLAAILIAWPFAEGGYCDDFSYIHMAKTLAETGRFAYIGWPTAMLGMRWFASQPYAIPTQPLTLSVSSLSQAAGTVRQVCLVVAGGMAVAMPVFAWCLPAWKRWHRERPPWPGSAVIDGAR